MIDYISVIPLGISGTALAVALIMTFTNQPFRNLQLYGTLTTLLVCYVIRFYPRGTAAGSDFDDADQL